MEWKSSTGTFAQNQALDIFTTDLKVPNDEHFSHGKRINHILIAESENDLCIY